PGLSLFKINVLKALGNPEIVFSQIKNHNAVQGMKKIAMGGLWPSTKLLRSNWIELPIGQIHKLFKMPQFFDNRCILPHFIDKAASLSKNLKDEVIHFV